MVELSKIEDLTRMLAIRGDDAYLSVARVRGNRVIVAATLKPGYQPVSGSEVLLKAFFNVIGESTEGEPVSLAETVLADANRTVDVIIGKSAAEEVAGNEYALKTFPNPSNPSTLIEFELPVASEVTLEVYNLLGQHIKTLVASEWKAAGVHQVAWDVRSDDGLTAATGIYLIRLHAGGEVFNQRITLVR